jgi:hypothetical protein
MFLFRNRHLGSDMDYVIIEFLLDVTLKLVYIAGACLLNSKLIYNLHKSIVCKEFSYNAPRIL